MLRYVSFTCVMTFFVGSLVRWFVCSLVCLHCRFFSCRCVYAAFLGGRLGRREFCCLFFFGALYDWVILFSGGDQQESGNIIETRGRYDAIEARITSMFVCLSLKYLFHL